MPGIHTVFVASTSVKVQHRSVFLDAVLSEVFQIEPVVISKCTIVPGGAISDKTITFTVDLISEVEVRVTQSNSKAKTTVSFQVIETKP